MVNYYSNSAVGDIRTLGQSDILFLKDEMFANTEIRRNAERLASLLVSLGWKSSHTTLSSLKRSVAMGDPDTCMDIIIFLICHYGDDFGRDFLSLYKIDVPQDGRNASEMKVVGSETGVDQLESSNIRPGVEFILGGNHPLNVRFRRISRFSRDVLGIHKVYLQESQFARQGFAKRKLDMIFDMVDIMKKGKKQGRCTKKRNHIEKACKSQEEHLHPRNKSPPCLLRTSCMSEMSNLVPQTHELERLWAHEDTVILEPSIEHMECVNKEDEKWCISTTTLHEHDGTIPQTTINPLFWTSFEDSSMYSHTCDSEVGSETDVHEYVDDEGSCLLESLEIHAQQALKVIQELSFT